MSPIDPVLPANSMQGRRVLIVSAADTRFSHHLRSLVASLQPVLALPDVDLACLDIGLSPYDLAWLARHTDLVRRPTAHFGIDAAAHKPALLSFLARPFLRDYFPGYDVYVWIDSDIWLQDPDVVARYVDGAIACGMALTHEEERAYRFQPRLFGWTAKHFLLGYGPLTGTYLLARPHVNAGFFALAGDATQWDAWARRYEAAIRRTGALVPHDQFALNHALHAVGGQRAAAQLLDPTCNWICDRGVPMWNDGIGAYCKPYPPYEPISALHLAGPAKTRSFAIRRTGGGSFTSFILRGTSPAHPVTDERPLRDGEAAPVAA